MFPDTAPWHLTYLEYSRKLKFGTIIARLNYANRFKKNGLQLETDGYPFRLAKATGKQWMTATNLDDGKNSPIRFHSAKARYVRLIADPTVGVGTWGGNKFSLSEVRFTYLNE